MKVHLAFAAALSSMLVSAAYADPRPLKAVGLAVNDLANPFFVAMSKTATQTAQRLGGPGVKVTTVSSNYDLNTQVGQVENLIANKVDIILINAADPKGIAPVLRKARAAGIAVVAVDVGAEGADATVMSDNAMAGREACRYIVQKLNGKGDVVIVNGPPVSATLARIAGCKSALADAPGIRVLSDNQNGRGSRDGGMEVMSNLLTAYPKIDAVYANNDPTAIGAELAIRQAKRRDIKMITSVDGAPDGETALKNPHSIFAASAAQNPHLIAEKAVRIGYDILHGKRPAQSEMLIPTPLVTKDNVSRHRGWGSR
ncbi:MAG: ABC transporter substrate-binding protein [Paludibacterium sp.]|uniref:ABC transporter substrate-binding protein n=1 Tax=Paludibacterium sp. TaxID=1917523 RepID=UPI0025F71276|nr:ABC transporter substrate-binding protein [Paludibacterium sp.]MBV8045559.1 ABC transporter substrate-binding protein [Paludibacterium sp.]MBV8645854.1 ABC transporter substrate-binding protein [Paludibacterium sp.]